MMRTGLPFAVLLVSAIPAAAQLVKPDEPAVDLQSLQRSAEVVKNIQSRYEKDQGGCRRHSRKTRIEGFSTPVISTGHFYQEARQVAGGTILNRPRKKSTSIKTM